MNRGSKTDADWTFSHRFGFNEAPIHESGKSALGYCKTVPSGGFNEAPIHESGK